MKNLIARFVREEEGQDLTEYALLVAFIAFSVVAGVTAFGGNIQGWFSSADISSFPTAPAGS